MCNSQTTYCTILRVYIQIFRLVGGRVEDEFPPTRGNCCIFTSVCIIKYLHECLHECIMTNKTITLIYSSDIQANLKPHLYTVLSKLMNSIDQRKGSSHDTIAFSIQQDFIFCIFAATVSTEYTATENAQNMKPLFSPFPQM